MARESSNATGRSALASHAGRRVDTLGTLGSSGKAEASVTVPAGLSPSPIGFRLDFAFLPLDVPGSVNASFASHAVPLTLVS